MICLHIMVMQISHVCTSKEAEYWGLGSSPRNSKPFASDLNVLRLFTVPWKLWVYFTCTMAKRFVNEFSKSPFTVEVKNWNIFLPLLLLGVMFETVENNSKNSYHVCIKLIKVVRKKNNITGKTFKWHFLEEHAPFSYWDKLVSFLIYLLHKK